MISEKALLDRPKMTPSEMRVLSLLCEGHVNKVIADLLDISNHTAKFHVINIMKKLGCETRTGAAVKAVRIGLVP